MPRETRFASALLVVLALALTACTPPPEAAIERGVRYFAAEVPEADPRWANLFGYLHRRFGLEVRDAGGRPLHAPGFGDESLGGLYARLDDPAAAVGAERIAALDAPVDRMVASALHCDRIPLPPDWGAVLRRAGEAGGYALTHAALASEWTRESGCRPETEIASAQRALVPALVALLEQEAQLTRRFETPIDLWIEGLAMLQYLGARALVRPEWIEVLIQMQNPDGGWPAHPERRASDPHASALALWVLLDWTRPEVERIRWVAAR